MNSYPCITIITPNLNGAKFLERTILSVTGQGYPNLEYFVIDGGSTDNSLNIIKKYSDRITWWECSPDQGLYHALKKGFEKSTGSIMGWLNSDDLLWCNSLFTLAEIFTSKPAINWIQGYPVVIDDLDRIVYHRPAVSSKFHFLLKDFLKDGMFIQQESTFWTRKLWDLAGGQISTKYQFAGDFELWMRFFCHDRLSLTEAVLGSFRIGQGGQLSKVHYQEYLEECCQITDLFIEMATEKEKRILKNILCERKINQTMLLKFPSLHMHFFERKIKEKPTVFRFDSTDYRFKAGE